MRFLLSRYDLLNGDRAYVVATDDGIILWIVSDATRPTAAPSAVDTINRCGGEWGDPSAFGSDATQ
jgi:hypothetical protein